MFEDRNATILDLDLFDLVPGPRLVAIAYPTLIDSQFAKLDKLAGLDLRQALRGFCYK